MMVDCHLPEPQNQSISFGPTQMIMAPHHTHYSEYEQKNNLLQMLGTIFRCILNRIEVVSIFLIYVVAFCVSIFSKNQNATEMKPIMISILTTQCYNFAKIHSFVKKTYFAPTSLPRIVS